MKKNILNYSYDELSENLENLLDVRYRVMQIFTSLHKKYAADFRKIAGIPEKLKDELIHKFEFPRFEYLSSSVSKDNTVKYLFEISDNNSRSKLRIETVLINEGDRKTICISTQAGCNVGCEFCATGKMGFLKNLDISQILLQVYTVSKLSGSKPTNLVFMGMGEPFLNYDNLLGSLKILTDKKGFGISSKRITISTVGLKYKITKFAEDLSKAENSSIKNIKLALSLHTTNQGIRESIIPVASKNKLSDLYQELIDFYKLTKNKVTYEYIFFPGINDTENDIKRLGKLSGMIPCNFNIIPFHPIGTLMKFPLDAFNNLHGDKGIYNSLLNKKLNHFIATLKSKKIVANLRSSSGLDIDAACGQLATAYKK